MKRTIKSLLLCFTVCLVLLFVCACNAGESDPCKDKVCIQCGSQASHYASGVMAFGGKANSSNSELISGSIYRIFYCNDCWNKIPKSD